MRISKVTEIFQPIKKFVLYEKHFNWVKIKRVALASLKELAVSLACTAFTIPFVSSPVGIAVLVAAAVAMVAFNTLVRAAGEFLAHQLQKPQDPETKKLLRYGLTLCEYLVPFTFSVVDNTSRDLVLHEAGHFVASKVLYKNAQPKITIKPFDTGWVKYTPFHLTELGLRFGRKVTDLVVSAAGPLASIVSATLQVGLSHALKKSFPVLSRYLLVSAIMSVASHVIYALTALVKSLRSPGHDFVALMAGGIHPVAASVVMIAVPVIVKLGFFLFDTLQNRLFPKNC